MKLFKSLLCSLFALSFFGPLNAKAAVTINNPSFEDDTYDFDVKTTFTEINGWTLSKGFGGGGYNYTPGETSTNLAKMHYSPDQSQWIEIDSYQDASEVFELGNEIVGLEIDHIYKISFSYFNGDSASAAFRVGDFMDANQVAAANQFRKDHALDPVDFGDVNLPVFSGDPVEWTIFEYTFAATAETMPLTFSGTAPHLYLDNLVASEIAVAPVPEPGATVMLGLAGAGLMGRRRRK